MTATCWLFVPGDRPERFGKAAGSGADAVILDLEDAVAPAAKESARKDAVRWLSGDGSAWVRINAVGTPWHDGDIAALVSCSGLLGVVAPKTEDPEAVGAVGSRLPESAGLMALIETARGVHRAVDLACSEAVDRLALGTIDLCADLGCSESDEALLLARSVLVLASRLGDLQAPVDGVTTTLHDGPAVRAASERARALGFGGKLAVHPAQVRPILEGFRPSTAEVEWARTVRHAATDGAAAVDGAMVDRAVLARADTILARLASASLPTRPRDLGD